MRYPASWPKQCGTILLLPPTEFQEQNEAYQLCARCGGVLTDGEVCDVVSRSPAWLIYSHPEGTPHCPPKAVRGWKAVKALEKLNETRTDDDVPENWRNPSTTELYGFTFPFVSLLDQDDIEVALRLVSYDFSGESPTKAADIRTILSRSAQREIGGGVQKRIVSVTFEGEDDAVAWKQVTHLAHRNYTEDGWLDALSKGAWSTTSPRVYWQRRERIHSELLRAKRIVQAKSPGSRLEAAISLLRAVEATRPREILERGPLTSAARDSITARSGLHRPFCSCAVVWRARPITPSRYVRWIIPKVPNLETKEYELVVRERSKSTLPRLPRSPGAVLTRDGNDGEPIEFAFYSKHKLLTLNPPNPSGRRNKFKKQVDALELFMLECPLKAWPELWEWSGGIPRRKATHFPWTSKSHPELYDWQEPPRKLLKRVRPWKVGIGEVPFGKVAILKQEMVEMFYRSETPIFRPKTERGKEQPYLRLVAPALTAPRR